MACLVAEAIGADHLLCVLMPYRTSSDASRADAELVVDQLGAASELVDISPMVDAFFAADPEASALRRGNVMARQRMTVLYDRSVTWGGLVVGTGNKTESLIGYTTLFGDSACAFNPIGDLYKSQVRQMAEAIGRAGRDHHEGAVGGSLARPDRRDGGRLLVSRPRPPPLLADRPAPLRRGDGRAGLRPGARRPRGPDDRHVRVQATGPPDREARAADGRRRLPLPAAAAGLRPPVTDAADRPAGVADQPAGGRLYVVATPIGNLADVTLRAIEVLGSVSLIAAEDTRMSRRLLDRHGIATRTTSYHARSGPARERQLLEALRSGADVALVTDAGTPGISDPGESLVAAWAGEGGAVVPIPGASAALAAIAGSGIAGPRWSFEGFLPRSGRERRERLARIAADPRGTVLYEAPGRVAATLGGPRDRLRRRAARGHLPRADEAPRGVRPGADRGAGGAGTERRADAPRRVRDRRRGGRAGPPARRRRSDGRGSGRGRARRGGPARRQQGPPAATPPARSRPRPASPGGGLYRTGP